MLLILPLYALNAPATAEPPVICVRVTADATMSRVYDQKTLDTGLTADLTGKLIKETGGTLHHPIQVFTNNNGVTPQCVDPANSRIMISVAFTKNQFGSPLLMSTSIETGIHKTVKQDVYIDLDREITSDSMIAVRTSDPASAYMSYMLASYSKFCARTLARWRY